MTSADCDTLGKFQDSLDRMRSIDDRILLTLNKPISGESAKSEVAEAESCAFFFRKLHDNSRERRSFIKGCIGTQEEFVTELENKVKADSDNSALKNLHSAAMRMLRAYEMQQLMENHIKEQTFAAFQRKCNAHFVGRSPPSL